MPSVSPASSQHLGRRQRRGARIPAAVRSRATGNSIARLAFRGVGPCVPVLFDSCVVALTYLVSSCAAIGFCAIHPIGFCAINLVSSCADIGFCAINLVGSCAIGFCASHLIGFCAVNLVSSCAASGFRAVIFIGLRAANLVSLRATFGSRAAAY